MALPLAFTPRRSWRGGVGQLFVDRSGTGPKEAVRTRPGCLRCHYSVGCVLLPAFRASRSRARQAALTFFSLHEIGPLKLRRSTMRSMFRLGAERRTYAENHVCLARVFRRRFSPIV